MIGQLLLGQLPDPLVVRGAQIVRLRRATASGHDTDGREVYLQRRERNAKRATCVVKLRG
jgi:hypothetical protein